MNQDIHHITRQEWQAIFRKHGIKQDEQISSYEYARKLINRYSDDDHVSYEVGLSEALDWVGLVYTEDF